MLHDHGIIISYDRVLEVSAQLGDAAVAKYVEDGMVCPSDLRRGLFTTAAMDNIDHNPTATTENKKTKTVLELPDSYTNIRPAFFRKKNPSALRAERLIVPGIDLLKHSWH